MEMMKVKILDSGIEARECNPLGREPIRYVPYKHAGYYTERDNARIKQFNEDKAAWQQAESELRTFEISFGESMYVIAGFSGIGFFEPGTIHDAEILSNGKIKITS